MGRKMQKPTIDVPSCIFFIFWFVCPGSMNTAAYYFVNVMVYLARNRELAEELFQETWIRVLERGRQYDGNHEFSTWLCALATNGRIEYLRKLSAWMG
jgi:DNA-directed RNA polymerase specialized sigma24 family protein